MSHSESQRVARYFSIGVLAVLHAVLGCGSSDDRGPTIGAPTGPGTVINEGGGATSVAGASGLGTGGSNIGGAFSSAGSASLGSAGADPFGTPGTGTAGSGAFSAGGSTFGTGGTF